MADYSPRLIIHPIAKRIADYRLILDDLEHVIACCECIYEPGKILDTTKVKTRAMLCSAIISYRRCFNGGQRWPLSKEKIKKLGQALLDKHRYVLDVANKHIAHSSNEYETMGTLIYISVGKDGKPQRGGFGANGTFTFGFSMADVAALLEIARRIDREVVRPELDHLEAQLKDVIDQMSDEEILALPSGFAPSAEWTKVGMPRKWPPSAK